MKKIIILALLSLSLIAGDFSYGGTLNTGGGKVQADVFNPKTQSYEKRSENIHLTNIQLNLDYENEDFYVQTSLYGYVYHTKSGDPLKFINYYEPVEKQDIFFRSLYISYKATDEISIGAGVLPLSNSTPTKYNNDYIQDGEGIYMLNDSVLTSVFATYKTENSRTILLLGTIDPLLVPTGNYIDETLRQGGSYSIVLVNKLQMDKFELTTQVSFNHMEFEQKNLSDAWVSGMALVYDDSEDSGWSVYGVAGFSVYNNDNADSKSAIYDKVFKEKAPAGDYIASLYPNSFNFEKKTYYGGASLLGARKDFSIGKQDFFVSGEWFHVYGDWISGNHGNIYMEQNNQTFNIRDNSYFLNLGYLITNNFMFRISTTYLEYEEQGKIGNLADTVPTEEFIGGGINSQVVTRVVFTYKF